MAGSDLVIFHALLYYENHMEGHTKNSSRACGEITQGRKTIKLNSMKLLILNMKIFKLSI